MKSTYKLFGTYWDHNKSIDYKDFKVIQGNQGIDYKQPFCIFDIIGDYRTINISELICVEGSLELDSICDKLRKHSRIAINIDYITHDSIISSKFYNKRIGQIYLFLQQALPDSFIVIQVPYDKLPDWKAIQELAT